MTDAPQTTTDQLEAQERDLVLDSFDHAVAWRIGSWMAERAQREQASVIIDVRRPTMVLFRAAFGETTPENDAWLERKARTVLRFETSTALLGARFAARGVDLWSAPWFDTDQFTAAGGAFPVRTRSAGVVGVITVSGLTSEEDHAFAVDALEQYLQDRRADPTSSDA